MHSDSALLIETNLNLLPQSLVVQNGIEYGMARVDDSLHLVLLGEKGDSIMALFDGDHSLIGERSLLIAPLNSKNAAILRVQLPWLQPQVLGLRTSAGLGDRLGFATPGHVRAVQKMDGKIAPIFAQQSMREMIRTVRTPIQVMDDAMWGVFQENWQTGFGADADHLKKPEDIDVCLSAGFTFFTIDPGAYVDNRAETASLSDLQEMVKQLPKEIQLSATGLLNQTLQIENMKLVFNEEPLLRAMVKYGNAIWHVTLMYQHLLKKAGKLSFEMEVSVDETDQPTTHAEHAYIASELNRLGVKWVSLAPRFIGSFEKGVDYIGNVAAFEADIAGHAAIARHFGPYKLSLHSGSDKFSIYPAANRQTRGLVHLKTAGTSYLEALRTIAELDIDFFRKIYIFARDRYETDRVSYHVSAKLANAPEPEKITNWPEILDQFDAREILHVTFGSVLLEQTPQGDKMFYDRFAGLLKLTPELYADNLERHFIRHLLPFTK